MPCLLYLLPGGPPPGGPPAGLTAGALWPRQESREGPSFGSAKEPSGLERSLKNAPPVMARPMVPSPVEVAEDPFAGSIGSWINCQPGHLTLGLVCSWSDSAGWSGIWAVSSGSSVRCYFICLRCLTLSHACCCR